MTRTPAHARTFTVSTRLARWRVGDLTCELGYALKCAYTRTAPGVARRCSARSRAHSFATHTCPRHARTHGGPHAPHRTNSGHALLLETGTRAWRRAQAPAPARASPSTYPSLARLHCTHARPSMAERCRLCSRYHGVWRGNRRTSSTKAMALSRTTTWMLWTKPLARIRSAARARRGKPAAEHVQALLPSTWRGSRFLLPAFSSVWTTSP